MSAHHHPDGWTILRFEDDCKIIYKIFATWRSENDDWRLSSGASDLSGLKKDGDTFIWAQASGSVYHLPQGGEHGYTTYQGRILEKIKSSCNNQNIKFSIVDAVPYFSN